MSGVMVASDAFTRASLSLFCEHLEAISRNMTSPDGIRTQSKS
jgi:hypothetical protein